MLFSDMITDDRICFSQKGPFGFEWVALPKEHNVGGNDLLLECLEDGGVVTYGPVSDTSDKKTELRLLTAEHHERVHGASGLFFPRLRWDVLLLSLSNTSVLLMFSR